MLFAEFNLHLFNESQPRCCHQIHSSWKQQLHFGRLKPVIRRGSRRPTIQSMGTRLDKLKGGFFQRKWRWKPDKGQRVLIDKEHRRKRVTRANILSKTALNLFTSVLSFRRNSLCFSFAFTFSHDFPGNCLPLAPLTFSLSRTSAELNPPSVPAVLWDWGNYP